MIVGKVIFYALSLTRRRKRAVQVTADVFLLALAFAVAVILRSESTASLYVLDTWAVMLAVVPATIAFFVKLGLYRAVVRYMAGRALTTIVIGAAFSGLVMSVVSFGLGWPIPRSVPLIYLGLTFVMIGATRFVFRELVFRGQSRRKEVVVIYGAGSAGRQLVQMLRQGTEYLPVAFVDDAPVAQETQVGGLMVYPPSQLRNLILDRDVGSVLLAMPSASRARMTEILKSLENLSVHLRTVPGLDDILSGTSMIDDINEIDIEDLLGRDPVPAKPELLKANIAGQSVMVTGAGGSIGSELCRQIALQKPKRIVLFELSEIALYTVEQELLQLRAKIAASFEIFAILGNVQSGPQVTRVMRNFSIQTVYHAAAYKHVPLVEHNAVEGVRNNVFGTLRVAEAAIACGVTSLILVSTDKAVRPTNLMGASKRLAEIVCQTLAVSAKSTTVSMVRFGNVLGSSGSVIPLFKRQIAAGGPITVTHPEITRFFMTMTEAAQLVIQAGAMARGGEVFVLDMGEPIRIAELATQMVRLHGKKPVLVSSISDGKMVGSGEIGIAFTHLRPGEKLYEELLIGNNPTATAHTRIMSAAEPCLSATALCPLLDALTAACDANDIPEIQSLMLRAQTAYTPAKDIVDYDWIRQSEQNTQPGRPNADSPYLSLVR